MRIFRSTSYANVTATLALVLALGGTSYAAVQITGKQIKDNTVTHKDIKDGNLKSEDFSAGAKSSLAGPAGPAGTAGPIGPAGPQGAVGPQGPAGPSNGYSVFNDNSTVLTGANKTVLTLNLPAGTYVVNSKVIIARNVAATTTGICLLNGGGASDYSAASVSTTETYETSPQQIVASLAAPGAITLNCSGANGLAMWKKMTAVRVGSLSNVAGPNVAFNGDDNTLR